MRVTRELDLLSGVLVDEHAAVYAYGVLGAHLPDAVRAVALVAFDAHRVRRDDLASRLRAAGQDPPAARPAYDVLVSGRDDALALAVRVEDALAVRWRDLVTGTVDPILRRLGVSGLTDSAVRATVWRRTAAIAPASLALPGQV